MAQKFRKFRVFLYSRQILHLNRPALRFHGIINQRFAVSVIDRIPEIGNLILCLIHIRHPCFCAVPFAAFTANGGLFLHGTDPRLHFFRKSRYFPSFNFQRTVFPERTGADSVTFTDINAQYFFRIKLMLFLHKAVGQQQKPFSFVIYKLTFAKHIFAVQQIGQNGTLCVVMFQYDEPDVGLPPIFFFKTL